MRAVKILIKLCEYEADSETSLGAHVRRKGFDVGSFQFRKLKIFNSQFHYEEKKI